MKIEIRHYTEAKRFDSINDGSIIEIKNTGNIDPEVADMQRAVYEMVTGMAPLQRINSGRTNQRGRKTMKIPITTEPPFAEGVLVSINRPDGTTRATIQDGYADNCDHDNYTDDGEPWVVCDTCLRLGNIVDDISDDGWDGEKRQYTVTKTIEWE